MRHSLSVGAAVLSGLMAVNTIAGNPSSLETRVSAQAPLSQVNAQFASLYRRIQSLESQYYKKTFDGNQIATDEAKVNYSIAKDAAGDISKYLQNIGIADKYQVIAAFTYRGEVILDARERNSIDNTDGVWISVNPMGLHTSSYKNISGLLSIAASGGLETPLPDFDELLKTVQYADEERGKLQGVTYSSTKLQYIRSLMMDLGVQIAKKCGLDTFMEFAPIDANALKNGAIRIDASKLIFYSDVGHWEPSNLTFARDRKVTLSVPTGYKNFKTIQLECKP